MKKVVPTSPNTLRLNDQSQSAPDSSGFLDDPQKYAQSVLGHIPMMSVLELERTALHAFTIQSVAFIIRACCIARLVDLAVAQPRGRGNKDQEGLGINATLHKLANNWKRDFRTLQMDRAIYAQFFREPFETGGLEATSLCGLERGYYRIALTALEPKAAIEMAIKKRQIGAYSLHRFNQDVTEMGKKRVAIRAAKGVKLVLDLEAIESLDECLEWMRLDHPEACASREQFVSFLIKNTWDQKKKQSLRSRLRSA